MDYNLIEFYNSCDLGHYLYQNGFKQRLYVAQDLGVPEYEKEEEGAKDGDGQFIPSFQKVKKTYILDLGFVPEYVVDALEFMQIHDTRKITLKDGSTAEMQDVVVESEWGDLGCFSRVKIKFSADFVSKTACCGNRTPCLGVDIDVIDIIQDTDDIYTDPAAEGISLGSRYFVWSANPAIGKYTGSVYQYVGGTALWDELDQYNTEGSVCYKVPATSVTLYYDGLYWWQYPLLNNYTESGDDLTVYGFAPPGTLVYVNIEVDGDVYNSPTILSDTFISTGITFTGVLAGGWATIKTITYCDTHSCDYGSFQVTWSAVPPP